MRQAEAQSVQNISKHMEELFASFYNAGNYDEAVRYLKTSRTIPAQVLDYIRSLDNPEMFEKVGKMIIQESRVKGQYLDCIGTALEFLDLAINSDDSKVDKGGCWTALADAHCRPELGVLDIRKAIDCYIKMIPYSKDYFSLALVLRGSLFHYLITSTDEQGVRYAMERIIKLARCAVNAAWTEFLLFLARWQFGNIRERNIFNMSVGEIFNLRIPGLKDRSIDLEGFMSGKRWLSPLDLSDAVPYDAEAERIVCEAALNGDENCAWIMVEHYHKTEQYDKVLEMSRQVSEHHHSYKETMRLLASMYKNGQGVEQDLEKARNFYMESVERKQYCFDIHGNHDYCHLGEIHRILYERDGKADDLMKARKYYKAIISPIIEVSNCSEPYRKYGTAFRELYRYSSSDTLRLTVKVEKGNKCAFSLKIIPFTCLAVDWGEKDGGLEHILIDKMLFPKITEKVSLKHQYKKGGVYRIKIMTEGAYSIDGIQYPSTRRQLLSVDTSRCPALKTFVACGQMLKTLDFSKNKYLHGVICRDNRLTQLDLRQCPTITHIDCSRNPELKDLLYDERSALTVLCAHSNTNLSEEKILDIYNNVLVKNRGTLDERQGGLYVFNLQEIDMRLEYYVRCSQWDRLVPLLKRGIKEISAPEYYDRYMDELERAFRALKALDVNDYDFPYKSGYLKVMDTYVSVEDLCNEHHICAEEFFITEHPWTECMAIPVRYGWHREPWMRFKPIEPEYFVAHCLLNMILNEDEKEKYIKRNKAYDRT